MNIETKQTIRTLIESVLANKHWQMTYDPVLDLYVSASGKDSIKIDWDTLEHTHGNKPKMCLSQLGWYPLQYKSVLRALGFIEWSFNRQKNRYIYKNAKTHRKIYVYGGSMYKTDKCFSAFKLTYKDLL